MLFAAEDGALWRDPRNRGYHFLVHRFAAANGSTAGSAVGGHAWSADGLHWQYSEHAAYNTSVRFRDGRDSVLYRRERPKPLLDDRGRMVGMWNGMWPCHVGAEDDDTRDGAAGCASFTALTGVGGGATGGGARK